MSTTVSFEALGIQILGEVSPDYSEILTAGAIDFLTKLHGAFADRRDILLKRREERQKALDEGQLPNFLPETAAVRQGDWRISSVPHDLQDRRVEITGPASDRKMVINALNSGAKAFMADLEDANSPTWDNVMQSQINLRDAVKRTITYTNPEGTQYALQQEVAVLIVRPRGWHLDEKHVLIHGKPIPAALFDFGLYLYHNATALQEQGTAPYFYLPKLEGHLEARLWNDVFVFGQRALGIPQGTIKATVLIETILAAFEMDEILYELKEHVVGLNCGRWDYIFSYLKKFRNNPEFILPNREVVTMTSPFMRKYSLLTIKTCHKRGAHAIGGMAAQIPVRNNPEANEEAFRKVRQDKEREVQDGHDGTWVAHPGLVPVALEVFDKWMPAANQVDRQRDDVTASVAELLEVPQGAITEEGVRKNIAVGIRYIEAWLRGSGAVPIFHLMEDAATAEISRAQLWQWIRHPKGVLSDGRKVTAELVKECLSEEVRKLQTELGQARYTESQFDLAAEVFSRLVFEDSFVEFLTLPAYEQLN